MSSCKVYDELHILRCYKCCAYGHNSKNCRNTEICHICGEEHSRSNKCKDETIRCINCISYNKHHDTKLQTNHTASDVNQCSVYKSKKDQLVSRVDYSTSPLLSQC